MMDNKFLFKQIFSCVCQSFFRLKINSDKLRRTTFSDRPL